LGVGQFLHVIEHLIFVSWSKARDSIGVNNKASEL